MCAIQADSLEIVKYANEQGCPWNEDVCPEARIYHRTEILEYLHSQGCPCACVLY